MAIGHDAVVNICEEGIEVVDDLEMVDKDFLKQLTDNIKRPGGQINVGGAMVAMPYFNFGANSHIKLESSSNIVWLYNTVGRSIRHIMIQWYAIIKEFKQDW